MKNNYEHLIPFGYAPGGYTCRGCRTCGLDFSPADKRAWNCQICAQIDYDINDQRLELRRLPKLDTNTRQLKRLGSLGAWFTSAKQDICNHCALINICDSVSEHKSCREFMPVLSFQDETGFKIGDVVNTVRIGKAWVERLTTGSTIALLNAKTKLIFSYARVIGLDFGPIDDMLKLHAATNHLFVNKSPSEAPALLKDWQLRNYGPHIVNDATKIAVIYLLPQPGEAVAPPFKGHKADRSVESGTPGAGEDN